MLGCYLWPSSRGPIGYVFGFAFQLADSKVNMGNIYFKQEKWTAAIKMYRMALDQIPNNVQAIRFKIMRNIGHAFFKMHQFPDAIDSYENLLMHGAQHLDFMTGFNLILCYFALGDKDTRPPVPRDNQMSRRWLVFRYTAFLLFDTFCMFLYIIDIFPLCVPFGPAFFPPKKHSTRLATTRGQDEERLLEALEHRAGGVERLSPGRVGKVTIPDLP